MCGNNSCIWIIVLILLFTCCGGNCGGLSTQSNEGGCGCGCNNNGCGC